MISTLMKKLIALFVALAALAACQKETLTFPLTMDAAIKQVDKALKQYPNMDWYASKGIIEPGTVLQYSRYGKLWDIPEMIHEYVSPDYRSWLVVLVQTYHSSDPVPETPDDECLHFFIDADTGKYLEVWLEGQAIVEWGSTPISRATGTR